MKLLCAVDLEEEGAWVVVDHAARFAARLGAHVHLLHVEPGHNRRGVHDHMSELAESLLKAELSCSYAVIGGEPGPTIVEEGNTADLVVMGTHGRKGLTRALLGSVAEHVVRNAQVPVMVTKVP